MTTGKRAMNNPDAFLAELTNMQPIPLADLLAAGVNLHTPTMCAGEFCTIHNPSDHHMRDWPQFWRNDRHMMERMRPHEQGHPDPDEINPDKVHGCDGCCVPPVKKEEPMTTDLELLIAEADKKLKAVEQDYAYHTGAADHAQSVWHNIYKEKQKLLSLQENQ